MVSKVRRWVGMQIEPRVASRPLLAVPPARLGEVPELARLLLGGTSGDVDVLLHAVVGDAVVRVRSGLDTAGSVVGVVAVDVAVVAGDFVVLLPVNKLSEWHEGCMGFG